MVIICEKLIILSDLSNFAWNLFIYMVHANMALLLYLRAFQTSGTFVNLNISTSCDHPIRFMSMLFDQCQHYIRTSRTIPLTHLLITLPALPQQILVQPIWPKDQSLQRWSMQSYERLYQHRLWQGTHVCIPKKRKQLCTEIAAVLIKRQRGDQYGFGDNPDSRLSSTHPEYEWGNVGGSGCNSYKVHREFVGYLNMANWREVGQEVLLCQWMIWLYIKYFSDRVVPGEHQWRAKKVQDVAIELKIS